MESNFCQNFLVFVPLKLKISVPSQGRQFVEGEFSLDTCPLGFLNTILGVLLLKNTIFKESSLKKQMNKKLPQTGLIQKKRKTRTLVRLKNRSLTKKLSQYNKFSD